ncbi:FCD domain-containing protein [bacterium]|nr:FCD domain-containing protein [bacterium]
MSNSKVFEPVRLKRTFELIIDLLREKIYNGELKIGDRLPSERDMAKMAEVSRNTVRQAYHILDVLGIVYINKGMNGGAIIREPSNRHLTQSLNDLMGLGKMRLEDIIEARILLEKDIIQLACLRISDADIEQLEENARTAQDLLQQGKSPHRQNLEYHLLLADIAKNPVIKMVYSSVVNLLSMIIETTADLEMAKIIADEHLELAALLRKRDLDQLLVFTEEHIQGSKERLIAKSDGKPILTKW